MKSIVITLVVLCNSIVLFSQSINLGFNSTFSGRNISAQYEFKKNKSEYSIGLGYNINKFAHNDNQNNLYLKRLYATDPIHYLNINFTYQFYILTEKIKNIQVFLFYDLQAKYSTTRTELILPYAYDPSLVIDDPEQGIVYAKYIEFFGPFLWLENNIGIGFTADLNDRLYIKQRIGVGTVFILGYDDQIAAKLFSWYGFGFSTLFQFSVGVRLHKSKN